MLRGSRYLNSFMFLHVKKIGGEANTFQGGKPSICFKFLKSPTGLTVPSSVGDGYHGFYLGIHHLTTMWENTCVFCFVGGPPVFVFTLMRFTTLQDQAWSCSHIKVSKTKFCWGIFFLGIGYYLGVPRPKTTIHHLNWEPGSYGIWGEPRGQNDGIFWFPDRIWLDYSLIATEFSTEFFGPPIDGGWV